MIFRHLKIGITEKLQTFSHAKFYSNFILMMVYYNHIGCNRHMVAYTCIYVRSYSFIYQMKCMLFDCENITQKKNSNQTKPNVKKNASKNVCL